MPTQTLPLEEDGEDAPSRADHLYLALTAGKPIGGARWSLEGVDRVEVGRGAKREARRSGRTMRVDVPDPWMSSSHVVFERERGHWVAVDAGSRNGILVNGAKQERALVGISANAAGGAADEVVEAGRSFFILRTGELAAQPALDATAARGELVTLDPLLAAAFDELRRVARSHIPVLVGGPTGSGKERIAQAVHASSGRGGAFVPVNCGALPAGLVESELFGHKRGAFSGAIADQPGLVASSSGGTLFLDEIGDLPAPAQAALLRVLEEHEVRAVGAPSAVRVDLRVVAATHRDLDALVEDGAFRDDLVARLAGFEIELPPLAERRVDLGVMLSELVPPSTQLAGAAARALFAYAWPRNVRELVRALERAVALSGSGELAPAHFTEEIATARFVTVTAPAAGTDARRDELVALLEKHRGNVSKVAVDLGRVRQQVQRWLKRYNLDPERYRT
ncbi:MAG: sigma 54-interacting transcriptional regulator [Deltaproteobacteria bacterium]|nr:sigma 54-interacting transcriptional regulator [Deltaproteobacteria bacterium]